MISDNSLENNGRREEDYLAALRDGDPATTETFVREHAVWMLIVSRRILRDNAHAEDAVQGAFVNIFNNLNSFDGRSAIKTWMHRIIVNQALMVLRKNRRMKETSIDDLMPEFDDNSCRIEERWATFETPESLLQQAETKKKISQLISLLPDKYRNVLVLRDIKELSTSDVAEALELSEANVKVRLHRARSALKKLLEPLIREQAI